MALQVQEVFPNLPRSMIVDDLRLTRSVELTLENIVEGRIVVPQSPRFTDLDADVISGDAASYATDTDEPTRVDNMTHDDADSYRQASGDVAAEMLGRGEWRLEENEQTRDEAAALLSSRFSKSPSERETMLRKRKDLLVQQARRRFLQSDGSDGNNSTES